MSTGNLSLGEQGVPASQIYRDKQPRCDSRAKNSPGMGVKRLCQITGRFVGSTKVLG